MMNMMIIMNMMNMMIMLNIVIMMNMMIMVNMMNMANMMKMMGIMIMMIMMNMRSTKLYCTWGSHHVLEKLQVCELIWQMTQLLVPFHVKLYFQHTVALLDWW